MSTLSSERSVLLVASDGPGILVRPLQADEASVLLEVFEGMSARSRELRFLTSKPALLATDVRHLMAIDHYDHEALVAWSLPDEPGLESRPIGIARFVRSLDDHEAAEVAVEVVDEWQSRGIGSALVACLEQRAHEVGIRRFAALISAENSAAKGLLRRTGTNVELVARGRGTQEYVATLSESTHGGALPATGAMC